MTKLISKIATGIAILGLAAPVLAATGAAPASASQPTKTSQIHQRKHKKLAQATDKKATGTASDKKATDKKATGTASDKKATDTASDKKATDKASDKKATDKTAQEKHESHAKSGAAKGAEKTETAPAGGTTTPAK